MQKGFTLFEKMFNMLFFTFTQRFSWSGFLVWH